MYPITPHDFYNDPALRHSLFEMARRERVAAIRACFAWLRDRLTPPSHPGNWIGRLG